jgi:hypothetical protein
MNMHENAIKELIPYLHEKLEIKKFDKETYNFVLGKFLNLINEEREQRLAKIPHIYIRKSK